MYINSEADVRIKTPVLQVLENFQKTSLVVSCFEKMMEKICNFSTAPRMFSWEFSNVRKPVSSCLRNWSLYKILSYFPNSFSFIKLISRKLLGGCRKFSYKLLPNIRLYYVYLFAFTLFHLPTSSNVQTDTTSNSRTDGWLTFHNSQTGHVAAYTRKCLASKSQTHNSQTYNLQLRIFGIACYFFYFIFFLFSVFLKKTKVK